MCKFFYKQKLEIYSSNCQFKHLINELKNNIHYIVSSEFEDKLMKKKIKIKISINKK